MKMSLVAQCFSPFQVISIPRDFDLKNIRLFPIPNSMKLLLHFLLQMYILYIGYDNKYVSLNLIVYLLINKSYISIIQLFYTDRNRIRVDVHVYNSGWAVCFEGVRFGQTFQPLIFEINGL